MDNISPPMLVSNLDDPDVVSTYPRHVFDDIAEKQLEKPTRTASFYLVFFFAVLPVWSVVPLSWAFVTYTVCTGFLWQQHWVWQIPFVFASSEVLFNLYHFSMSHYTARPTKMVPNSLAELQSAYARVFRVGLGFPDSKQTDAEHTPKPDIANEDIVTLDPTDPRAVDFRAFLRTWFRGAPWSTIRRENIYTWVYWSYFNETFATKEDITNTRHAMIEETIELLERRTGMKLPEGFNPDVESLRLTVDPVTTAARPFIWYLVVSSANWLLKRRLDWKWSARSGTYDSLDYLLRIPEGWSATTGPRPTVFLHGLGLGLIQYSHFLETMFENEPDRPFLVPLFPHVSQEIFHPRFLKPIGRHESTKCIGGLLKELGWVENVEVEAKSAGHDGENADEKNVSENPASGVTMLSHSNGTFIHCWLLKAHPEMITRSCFVDPVVFCQWEGDLCYNFCYRPCSTGLELIIKYFVGMELGVAYYIQRHFCWSSNTLWFEEIPNGHDPLKAKFIIGGKDAIVNGPRVCRYLQSHGVNEGLYYDPEGRHGQALLTTDQAFTEVVAWLRGQTTNPTTTTSS